MAKNTKAVKNTSAKPAPKAAKPEIVGNTNVVALVKAISDSIDAKPAKPAPKAKPEAAPKPEAFAIHVNKTGRVCFSKAAAIRMKDVSFMACNVAEDGTVRLIPAPAKAEGILDVRMGGNRPYVSATKQFKPLGFDGSKPYDIEAKPLGDAGFEFRLQ